LSVERVKFFLSITQAVDSLRSKAISSGM
jgi:hypothetical protein